MFGKIGHVFSGTVNADVVETMDAAEDKIEFNTIDDFMEARLNTFIIADFDAEFYGQSGVSIFMFLL
jgi:hypothetical protein